jgi:hypothetical protein
LDVRPLVLQKNRPVPDPEGGRIGHGLFSESTF